MPIRPVDLKQATGGATSIYEAIVVMSRRARQINDELKENLSRRLESVMSTGDEEGDITNFDQLEISREFDRIPKPTFLALDEMLDGEIEHRYRDPH
ncbi:MAG TPA: DNA-directed RNA polymerase subunit omega [Candidatus Kapabacteria bacterium]|jgi:DNA-directed RNA polymerase subunit K/omega|nr:DNA-directed RNA polymerase subunit omega [Candidatus Kapabacteria bacterium]